MHRRGDSDARRVHHPQYFYGGRALHRPRSRLWLGLGSLASHAGITDANAMAALNAMKRWLLWTADALLFSGVVYVAYLQSRHINAGFWTNYGGDVIGPVWLYSGLRQLKIYRKRYPSPEITAGGVFAACFLWEWCQRYDLRGTVLSFTRGTFDPYDILCYGLSLLLAYTVDKTSQWMANKAVQRTGASRSVDETNPTSSSAGSRR